VEFKNYYELLEIAPTAPADEVKKAFRLQIARYHPDKVQHLGKEFQNMAAHRAAELTEAYRILSDEGRRAEYDRIFAEAGGRTTAVGASAASAAAGEDAAVPRNRSATAAASSKGTRRADRSSVQAGAREPGRVRPQGDAQPVRQALDASAATTTNRRRRLRHGVRAEVQDLRAQQESAPAGRFVSVLDAKAVAEAWTDAAKWADAKKNDVCVC
jgi:curved DNA-binding protein CbpA